MLALTTGGPLSRRLIGGRFESRIPFAPPSAPRSNHRIVFGRQVFKDQAVCCIDHDGSGRDFDDKILAVSTSSIRAHSMRTVFGFDLLSVRQVNEAVHTGFGNKDYASTISAITAIRSAPRFKSLSAKTHTSISAVASGRIDFYAIYKHQVALDYSAPLTARQIERRIGLGKQKKDASKKGTHAVVVRCEPSIALHRIQYQCKSVGFRKDVDSSTFAIKYDFAVNQGE